MAGTAESEEQWQAEAGNDAGSRPGEDYTRSEALSDLHQALSVTLGKQRDRYVHSKATAGERSPSAADHCRPVENSDALPGPTANLVGKGQNRG